MMTKIVRITQLIETTTTTTDVDYRHVLMLFVPETSTLITKIVAQVTLIGVSKKLSFLQRGFLSLLCNPRFLFPSSLPALSVFTRVVITTFQRDLTPFLCYRSSSPIAEGIASYMPVGPRFLIRATSNAPGIGR